MHLLEDGPMAGETDQLPVDGFMYEWYIGAQQCFSRWCFNDDIYASASVTYSRSASGDRWGNSAIQVDVYSRRGGLPTRVLLRNPANAVLDEGSARVDAYTRICTMAAVGNKVILCCDSGGAPLTYVVDPLSAIRATVSDYSTVGGPNPAGAYGTAACAEWYEPGRHVVVSRVTSVVGMTYEKYSTDVNVKDGAALLDLYPWYEATWCAAVSVGSDGVASIDMPANVPSDSEYLNVPCNLRLTVNGVDVSETPTDIIHADDTTQSGFVGLGARVNWVPPGGGAGAAIFIRSYALGPITDLVVDLSAYSIHVFKSRAVGRNLTPFQNIGQGADSPAGQMDIFSPIIKVGDTLYFTTRRYGHERVLVWAITKSNILELRSVFSKRYFQVGQLSAVGDVLVVPVYEAGSVHAHYSYDGASWVRGHELMTGVSLEVDPSFYDEDNYHNSFLCPPYLPCVPVVQRINRYLKRTPMDDYGKIPIG